MSKLDLSEGNKLFINKRVFRSFTKYCGTRSEYTPFYTASGIIKFCFEEHGPVNVVRHQQDLKNLFPHVDIDAL